MRRAFTHSQSSLICYFLPHSLGHGSPGQQLAVSRRWHRPPPRFLEASPCPAHALAARPSRSGQPGRRHTKPHARRPREGLGLSQPILSSEMAVHRLRGGMCPPGLLAALSEPSRVEEGVPTLPPSPGTEPAIACTLDTHRAQRDRGQGPPGHWLPRGDAAPTGTQTALPGAWPGRGQEERAAW